jgi:nicotinamide-nucleotide amidase
MIVELINTGSELMLGRVLNTHQQWLCRKLADLGYVVSRQVAVADTAKDILQAVRESLGRADLVITTGGLGPTSDDITRELIAELLGKKLVYDESVARVINGYFASRNRPTLPRTLVQAMVPEGATVLPNSFGTAPGLAMEVSPNSFRANGQPSWLVMLPGPPRELRPMFQNVLVPLLKRVLPPPEAFVCRTLRVTGMGESLVEQSVAPDLEASVQGGLLLGYCARTGQVDVRLAAAGEKAGALVNEAERLVRSRIGPFIYGQEDEEIEEVIVRMLTQRKETLALAESCTGGSVANRITNIPGASAVFLAGLVTYSNEAKQLFLGVKAGSIVEHGAVSEQVAREMAEGARAKTRADYAISITGIAGPGGGTPEKPVGTVCIGLAGPFETIVERNLNSWDRETFKYVTTQQALEMLRRAILRRGQPSR